MSAVDDLASLLNGKSVEKIVEDKKSFNPASAIKKNWNKGMSKYFILPPLNLIPEGTAVEKFSLYRQANEIFLEAECQEQGITVEERVQKRLDKIESMAYKNAKLSQKGVKLSYGGFT